MSNADPVMNDGERFKADAIARGHEVEIIENVEAGSPGRST